MVSGLLFGLAVGLSGVESREAVWPGTVRFGVEAEVRKIGMTSCFTQNRPQPGWAAVNAYGPDTFLFLGDNIYFDDRNGTSGDWDIEYGKLAAMPGFGELRGSARGLAIWDDHDYGLNDAGEEFGDKLRAESKFEDFWGLPAGHEVRSRPGIYHSAVLGPAGRRVQFLMLDTRFFRSPLKRSTEARGGYLPDMSPEKTILGAAQWAWLEEELKKPADLRIIASSIQVVAEDHRFEKWANLPRERTRLFDVIRRTGAEGVVFVSGDRHLAEISMMDGGVGYPLYDLTASALSMSREDWRMQESNRWRVGSMNFGNNFGTIEIDWEREDPEIRLQVRDLAGDVILQQKLKRSWLRVGRIAP